MSQDDKHITAEHEATALFRELLEQHRDELAPIARWGDGEGGYMLTVIQEVFCLVSEPQNQPRKKKVISQALRTKVFERDRYRCKHCYTHLDLCVDHIIAEAIGGPTNLDNLQTLCRSCNSKKGVSACSSHC